MSGSLHGWEGPELVSYLTFLLATVHTVKEEIPVRALRVEVIDDKPSNFEKYSSLQSASGDKEVSAKIVDNYCVEQFNIHSLKRSWERDCDYLNNYNFATFIFAVVMP